MDGPNPFAPLAIHGNRCLLAVTGESSFQGLLGGAGFPPSTVGCGWLRTPFRTTEKQGRHHGVGWFHSMFDLKSNPLTFGTGTLQVAPNSKKDNTPTPRVEHFKILVWFGFLEFNIQTPSVVSAFFVPSFDQLDRFGAMLDQVFPRVPFKVRK